MKRLLEGMSSVVTGAGAGIGRGHALLLAQYGARVVVNDINLDAASNVVAEIEARNGIAVASAENIATRQGAEALIAACVEQFGAIDVLVNNAGNVRDRALLKMSDEDFDAVWQVHVKGTFWCMQASAAAMKAAGHGGSIINTSSAAHFGNHGQANYSSAKGAIASMTYTCAIELAASGITVNAICPIAMTDMTRSLMPKGAGLNPAQFYDAARCAPLVVYLASSGARNVTGQIFGVGGERLSLVVKPHFGKTLNREGGWTVEAIQASFQDEFVSEFGPFGMTGASYPYAGGVTRRDDRR